MNHQLVATLGTFLLSLIAAPQHAMGKDFFLTIGGGYSPSGNQVSLERNVLFYQDVLENKKLGHRPHSVYFADGSSPQADLQVVDRSSIPRANQLMAEFFGSRRDLGLSYRDHQIPGVQGETSTKNIRTWFNTVGRQLVAGDRLIIYVTSHGHSSDTKDRPHNTSISLWNRQRIRVNELVELLDELPRDVAVVAIMVQCHSGGFARIVYNDGDSDNRFSAHNRCGFFATVHDRPAAGCTPDIDEATYVEYSTYFWEAIAGRTRLGQPIERPDYNGDGKISFREAHAYTLLTSDTIDLPITTSGEFLGVESGFRDQEHPDLLPRELPYSKYIELATPSERAVLEGLSAQLELQGEDRLSQAERESKPPRTRGRGRSRSASEDPAGNLRRKIAGDIRRQWPQLANLMNPLAIELVTTRRDEFIKRIENHKDYKRYRELAEQAKTQLSRQEKRVKYERFVRAAENVIMRENLNRLGDDATIARYKSILEAEMGSLD